MGDEGIVRFAWRAGGRVAVVLSSAYLLALVGFWGLLVSVGERWWPLWPLLYAPPQLALVPVALMLPLAALMAPRAGVALGLAAGFAVFVYMDFGWSGSAAPSPGAFKVLTNNTGQKNGSRLTPFIEREQPDVIVLQDAFFQGPSYARQYRDRHVAHTGEFVVISRFPIRSVATVRTDRPRGAPVAARFELELRNRSVALYNVHFPSPRRELRRLWGLGMVKELLRQRG